ncbi:MAG: CIA30 family protein [Xanthomonadales bacterium]|nr:CIA30 family protein [Xanthomonadales bacterium]
MNISLNLNPETWQAVNDGVMGGVSTGRMVQAENFLRFEGEISLENNGGFASVRHLVGQDLSPAKVVRLALRGDGRSYQFRIRLDGHLDGVAWRAEFDTTGEWQTVELSLDEFVPVFRGRQVIGAGPVVPANIIQVGFMLADKKSGTFALEIKSIEFMETSTAWQFPVEQG